MAWVKLDKYDNRGSRFPTWEMQECCDVRSFQPFQKWTLLKEGEIGNEKMAICLCSGTNGQYACSIKLNRKEYHTLRFHDEAKLLQYLERWFGCIIWK